MPQFGASLTVINYAPNIFIIQVTPFNMNCDLIPSVLRFRGKFFDWNKIYRNWTHNFFQICHTLIVGCSRRERARWHYLSLISIRIQMFWTISESIMLKKILLIEQCLQDLMYDYFNHVFLDWFCKAIMPSSTFKIFCK